MCVFCNLSSQHGAIQWWQKILTARMFDWLPPGGAIRPSDWDKPKCNNGNWRYPLKRQAEFDEVGLHTHTQTNKQTHPCIMTSVLYSTVSCQCRPATRGRCAIPPVLTAMREIFIINIYSSCEVGRRWSCRLVLVDHPWSRRGGGGSRAGGGLSD